MGQYTKPTVVASATISDTYLWDEFYAIADAHNKHVAGDFTIANVGSWYNTIPPAAVIHNQGPFVFSLASNRTHSGALSSTTVLSYCVIPFQCTLVRGFASAELVPTGGLGNVVVYKEGTPDDVVFSNTTLAADATLYDAGSPLIADMSAGDVLSLRAVQAAPNTAKNFCFSIYAKAFHREVP